MTHHCINITKTEDKKASTIEIKAEIPSEQILQYRTKALARIKKDASLDGFRKGHVPEDILVKHVGEGALLQEAADIAISEELPLLLATESVPAIAAPHVTVTKLAPGNPLGFTAVMEILPTVDLPDVAAIAKKINAGKKEVTVEQKEIDDVLLHLRKERAKIEMVEKGEKAEDAAEKIKRFEEKDLPEIDDEFVKGLGYENAALFKEKLHENMRSDKTAQEKDKHRVALLDAITEKVSIAIPHSLIDSEIHKMEAQFNEDLVRAGTNFEDYLKQIGKTHDDIHTEWHEPAEKRAKVQLILSEIAIKNDIHPDKDEVQKHVEHTTKTHKDVPEDRARAYFEHMLRNEAVMHWLEGQK